MKCCKIQSCCLLENSVYHQCNVSRLAVQYQYSAVAWRQMAFVNVSLLLELYCICRLALQSSSIASYHWIYNVVKRVEVTRQYTLGTCLCACACLISIRQISLQVLMCVFAGPVILQFNYCTACIAFHMYAESVALKRRWLCQSLGPFGSKLIWTLRSLRYMYHSCYVF